MRKILLASHSRLASGLKESLEFFIGKSDDIVVVDAYVDATDDYMKDLQCFIDNAQEGQAVIFTDIYGGSVNQQVTTMVIDCGKQIPIITGMNLPIVLSIALTNEELKVDRIQKLLEECTPQVVELQLSEMKEGDDDGFFC